MCNLQREEDKVKVYKFLLTTLLHICSNCDAASNFYSDTFTEQSFPQNLNFEKFDFIIWSKQSVQM